MLTITLVVLPTKPLTLAELRIVHQFPQVFTLGPSRCYIAQPAPKEPAPKVKAVSNGR